MELEIEVFRMSGAGNLFSVINNDNYNFEESELKKLSILLCTKNNLNDFCAEGLIALSKHNEYDFEVKFFNPDGSSGMMCGNGGRCAIDFAFSKILSNNKDSVVKFLMAGSVYKGNLNEFGVLLELPPPIEISHNVTIMVENEELTGSYINVGSDHFVVNSDDLMRFGVGFDNESITNFAPLIRYNSAFGNKGTNVNVYKIMKNNAKLITYERGVEGITGACGTGAISTAIHCLHSHDSNLPLYILPPSNIPLIVDFEFDNGNISKIILTGHSEIIGRDFVKFDINKI